MNNNNHTMNDAMSDDDWVQVDPVEYDNESSSTNDMEKDSKVEQPMSFDWVSDSSESELTQTEISSSSVDEDDDEDDESKTERETKDKLALEAIEGVKQKIFIASDKMERLLTKYERKKLNDFSKLNVSDALEYKKTIRDIRYKYGLVNEDSLRLLYALDDIRGSEIVRASRKQQVAIIQKLEDKAEANLKDMAKHLNELDEKIVILEAEELKLKEQEEKELKIQQEKQAEDKRISLAALEEELLKEQKEKDDIECDSNDNIAAEEGDAEMTDSSSSSESEEEQQKSSSSESEEEQQKSSQQQAKKIPQTPADWKVGKELNIEVQQRDGNNYIELLFQLPHVEQEDVKIEYENKKLIVSGIRKSSRQNILNPNHLMFFGQPQRMIRKIPACWFQKEFTLSDSLDSSNIRATFRGDILIIRIPYIMQQKQAYFRRQPTSARQQTFYPNHRRAYQSQGFSPFGW